MDFSWVLSFCKDVGFLLKDSDNKVPLYMFYKEEFNLQTTNRLNKSHAESSEQRFDLNPTGSLNFHTPHKRSD